VPRPNTPPGYSVGIAVAMLAMAALPLGVTGANLAFPALEATFSGTARETLVWALSGYSIVIAAFTLLGGQLSDRLGSFKMFTLGIGAYGLFNMAAAIAPSAELFIVARLLQGAGGALIVPSSLAVALARCPPERRTFTIGIWTASFPIGSSFAPVCASLLLEWSGWRAIFWATSAVCIVALAIALRLGNAVPQTTGDQGTSKTNPGLPDFIGILVGTLAVGLAALGVVQGRSWGWTSPATLASLGAAGTLAPLFVWRSRRHANPLIKLDLFKIRSFNVANIANVLVSMVGTSTWLLWPLLMHNIWDYSNLRVGIAMTPTPVMGGIGSILAARYAATHGHRRLLVVGSVFFTLACASFAFLPTESPNYWTGMFPGLILMGFGMGMTFAPLNGAALVDIPTDSIGQANAVFSTGRFLSGALGVSAVIAALSGKSQHPLRNFDEAFVLLTIVGLLAFLVLFVLWDRPRRVGTQPDVAAS
jgi:EmrB/QacA subfamily drug resistance transporter